jgi:two-component system, NarL family, nitrate/nitrite response regulator NarL
VSEDDMSGKKTPERRPKVAVAGQFRLVVETVARPLAAVARVQAVDLESCVSLNAARDRVLRSRVDLVVVVASLHDLVDSRDLVAELADHGMSMLVVGQVEDPGVDADLIEGGTVTVLDGERVSDLVRFVRQHPTARPLPRVVPTAPVRRTEVSEARRTRQNLARLTAAEARILWHLMHGSTVNEIARAHVVSVETVRSQIRALLGKLETGSQLAAVALAWRVGWRPTPAALAAA